MPRQEMMENRIWDELAIGDTASSTRTLNKDDIRLFALVSGDVNPVHFDSGKAGFDPSERVIAHGMWGGGLISAVLGNELPGPGSVYVNQSLHFVRPVGIGDTTTTTVRLKEKHDPQLAVFDCRCVNQHGDDVIIGEATVKAPTVRICIPRARLPDVRIADHDNYHRLIDRASTGEPEPTAVAHPCSASAITAAVDAAAAGLIRPILVGPEAKIRAAAEAAGQDISAFRIVPAPHSHAAAQAAVALVRSGEARLLMKGSLHTDEFLAAIIASKTGLRTERRISHVYLMDVPDHARPLLITDAAINVEPDLMVKADIIRNAIDLAHVMGIGEPKVAILAAVENINPEMPSTLDAAALCKMADRGQISGGLLDGPLAFDNAISEEAAREKGIVSAVAGKAEILVVPNLEAGNMLAKQLTFLGGADAAGIVLGARVPVILTSRADSLRTRLASCAVAVLLARAATMAAPGIA